MSIPHYTALPPARSGPCDMVVPPPCRHAPCHHRLQLQYGGTSSSGCAALCWCLVLHGSCSSAFVEGGCASKIRLACQTFWCSSSDIREHLRRPLPYHALLLLHPYCTLPFRTSFLFIPSPNSFGGFTRQAPQWPHSPKYLATNFAITNSLKSDASSG